MACKSQLKALSGALIAFPYFASIFPIEVSIGLFVEFAQQILQKNNPKIMKRESHT